MSKKNDPHSKVKARWNDLLTKPVEEMKHWRAITFGLLFISILLLLGFIGLGMKSNVSTWIIEVDQTGRAVVAGKAENIDVTDNRIVRAYLYRFIEMARSVITDPHAMRRNFDEVYKMASPPTQNFLTEYYKEFNPFEKAKSSSIQVVPVAFLKESDRSFIVEWKEIERDLNSRALPEKRFKSLITIDRITIKSEKDLIDNPVNPFGIVVQNISWSESL